MLISLVAKLSAGGDEKEVAGSHRNGRPQLALVSKKFSFNHNDRALSKLGSDVANLAGPDTPQEGPRSGRSNQELATAVARRAT